MSTIKCILPRLNDCGGDLEKQWFVYYSIVNPETGKLKRIKVYKGFQNIPTAVGRRVHANKLIKDLSRQLHAGWTPFDERKVIYFDDAIQYQNEEQIFGKRKSSVNPLRLHLSGFLDDEKLRISPKTFESYQSKTRKFSQWLEANGVKDISQITNATIKQFFIYLAREKNLSRPTIEKYQQNLTTLFNYLMKRKLVPENPVHDLPRTGLIVDYAPKPIKNQDILVLKEAILDEDPQLWLACLFQFYCFIRPGTELRLLKIFHVDLEAAKITVTNTLAKNRRAEVVQIPDPFLEIIINEYHLQDYPADLYVFGRDGRPGPDPLGKNTLRVRFNHYRDKLGLSKEYKFYSWKHTGATAAVDAGIPERHLMDQLRHKSFETTDHYFRRHKGYRSPDIQVKFPKI